MSLYSSIRIAVCWCLLFVCAVVAASDTIRDDNTYDSGVILYNDDGYDSMYGYVLQESLPGPGYDMRRQDSDLLISFPDVMAIEAYDFQAEAFIQSRQQYYWYPQYAATVVIAVDRDETNKVITGWKDLLYEDSSVCLAVDYPESSCIVMAAAYGAYHQLKADEGTEYFRQLKEKGTLLIDSSRDRMQFFIDANNKPADVYLMFDYQARNLNNRGRHLEIVMPKEGTLTFKKGLLSRKPLSIDAQRLSFRLQQYGFRPLTPLEEPDIEPQGFYAPAAPIQDMAAFAGEASIVHCYMQRRILAVDYLTSNLLAERMLVQLLCLLIAVFWTGYMIRRVVQRGVRQALFYSGVAIAAWLVVRILKSAVELPTLVRLCWYTYFGFEMAISLLLLWIAYATDRRVEDDYIPPWLRHLFLFDILLELAVLTNDWHQMVFTFLPGFLYFSDKYGYGLLYWLILFVILAQIIASLVILYYKARSQQSLQKTALIPFLMLPILLIYIFGYIYGFVPFRKSMHVEIIIFVLLFFLESALRTGLISSNRGYIDLFSRSNLAMKIFHHDGRLAFAASQTMESSDDVVESTMPISGGHVVWYENVREIREKQRELLLLSQALQRTYRLLKQEEKIRRVYIRATTKNKLYQELEIVIHSKRAPMSKYLDILKKGNADAETFQAIRRLNLLACYIKKRCVMLLRGKEQNRLSFEELYMAVEETKKYALEAGLDCAVLFHMTGGVATDAAMLLYDTYEYWIEQCLLHGAAAVLFNFYTDDRTLYLGILFETASPWMSESVDNIRARNRENQMGIDCKTGDDAFSITIFVHGGGGAL
jgi:hypothetical protein